MFNIYFPNYGECYVYSPDELSEMLSNPQSSVHSQWCTIEYAE